MTVALTRNGPHVELSIIDTGQGIPPDFLPHVFSRFRQGDAASNRRIDGRELVKQVLEDCQMTVHTAGSAAEALDRFCA